jgi:hypothetical protein
MTTTPTAAPNRSYRSGLNPSTATSQSSAKAMNTRMIA